jgi:hypothetical protein
MARKPAMSRPDVGLSPAAYNGRVGLALFCLMASQVERHPFDRVATTARSWERCALMRTVAAEPYPKNFGTLTL